MFADGKLQERESGERWGRLEVDTSMSSQQVTLRALQKGELATLETRRLRHKWRRENVQNPKEHYKNVVRSCRMFNINLFDE